MSEPSATIPTDLLDAPITFDRGNCNPCRDAGLKVCQHNGATITCVRAASPEATRANELADALVKFTPYCGEDHEWQCNDCHLSLPADWSEIAKALRAYASLVEENAKLRTDIEALGATAYARCLECGAELGLSERVTGSLCGQCWHNSYRCNDTLCRINYETGLGAQLIVARATVNRWKKPSPATSTAGAKS